MFAVIVEAQIAPEKRTEYQAAIAEYLALRAEQAGAGKTFQVDVGDDRELFLFLWESADHSDRAHADLLIAAARRLFPPVLVTPQRVLGYGEVTEDSLSLAALPPEHPGVAFVNEAVIAAEQRADYDAQSKELSAVRAIQPGFRGVVEFDAGAGRVIWLALWESREALQAARAALLPVIDRVHVPIVSRGSLGSGPLVHDV